VEEPVATAQLRTETGAEAEDGGCKSGNEEAGWAVNAGHRYRIRLRWIIIAPGTKTE